MYSDIPVGSNNGLSYTFRHKIAETESERYQLVDSTRQAIDLLKTEPKDKQAKLINFINIIKTFTVKENKNNERREQQVIKLHNRSNNDHVVS